MKFNITKERAESYTDQFVVEVKIMFGDADGEETVVVGGFNRGRDEHFLKEVIQVCIDLSDLEAKRNRNRNEEYIKVKNFNKWFDYENSMTNEEFDQLTEVEQRACSLWGMSYLTDYSFGAYENHKVYYYDSSGGKYLVNVVEKLSES